MSRLLLILISFLIAPLAAGDKVPSLADWNYEELHDDVRLDQLLGAEVESMADRQMGRLRDVVVESDGDLEAAVVEFQEGIGNTGVAIGIFEWADTVAEPTEGAVTVSIGSSDEPAQEFEVDGLPVSDIVGRRVVLADDPEFGQVADILVDLDDEHVSALLIDAGGTLYALPARINTLAQESGFVRYPFYTQQVTALGAYTDNARPLAEQGR